MNMNSYLVSHTQAVSVYSIKPYTIGVKFFEEAMFEP